MRSRVWWAVAVATVLGVRAAAGQHGDSAFAHGVQAYDNLDFHSASMLLRRVVATPRGRAPSELESALFYLGASEWYEGLRDSAVAVFRTLVILDPRYRASELVFPPEITGAFADVRRLTKVLDVVTASDTATIQAREGRFSAWVVASSPHPVTVALLREDGTSVRTLYAGPIGDSLEVHWDGLDSSGAAVGTGTLFLSATSRGADQHPIRTVRIPLAVTTLAPTLVPTPPPLPDSLFLPEQEVKHGSGGSLAVGLIDGALVAVLPSVIAAGTAPSAARFAVAGGVGLAGLAEFIAHHGTRPVPQNIAANERLRQAWQRRVDATAQENAARRREPTLVIHVGSRTVIEQEAF
jgi:hypothetical protein